MFSTPAAFAALPLPPPQPPRPVPVSPSSVHKSSPRPVPRSPYTHAPAPIAAPVSSPRFPASSPTTDREAFAPPTSPRSPIDHILHDVLRPGDLIAPGRHLHHVPLRLVPQPDVFDPHPPAPCLEIVRKLGSGSYAVVYLARERLNPPPRGSSQTDDDSFAADLEFDDEDADDNWDGSRPVYGREFAVKCLSKANLDPDQLVAQRLETELHQSLPAHPNIVTLHRSLESDAHLLLILECVPGEDLFYFLEQARDHGPPDDLATAADMPYPSRTPPSPSLLSSLHPAQLLSPARLRLVASMFSQMCDAVATCHAHGVYHRDIKPENFIVTDGWIERPDGSVERKVVVKLSDFGLATNEAESADLDCGSAPYMSYECRNNCAPTYSTRAADVWSLGIVLINMLYHHNPWSDTTDGACPSFEFYRSQPVQFFLSRFTGMTPGVAEFLAHRVFCILGQDPHQRVTAEEFGRWIKQLPTLLTQHALSRDPTRVATHVSSRMVPSALPEEDEDEDDDQDQDQDQDQDLEGMRSRSASAVRRRKRGARKNKKTATGIPPSVSSSTVRPATPAAAPAAMAPTTPKTPKTPSDDVLADLANGTQALAREISKTSRKDSVSIAGSEEPPAPTPPPAKKPSKWKGVFRMTSSDALTAEQQHAGSGSRHSPVPPVPPIPSATAANVSSLIMGLDPQQSRSLLAPPAPGPASSADGASWRGRRREPRAAPAPPPSATASSNWRAPSSASTTSASTGAFTRFSNASARSVSTVATSVSGQSANWRTKDAPLSPPPPAGKTKADPPKPKRPLPPPPAGLKIIDGVPWELHELPRGCHVRPNEHVFSLPPPSRNKKRPPPLEPIKERQIAAANAHRGGPPTPSPSLTPSLLSYTTSSEEGPGQDVPPRTNTGGVVQKGQIHTLAKMLSALKASHGKQ